MGNYLVTGRAGSGKSTLAEELNRRGRAAFDTDSIDRLSHWEDRKTHTAVTLTDNRFVDLANLEWRWDASVLRSFLQDKDGVFICGGADNDFDFEDLFAAHFVLSTSPETQIKRLSTRTSNDYAQDPAMHADIIEKQRQHVANAKLHDAIVIDAEKPIEFVVNAILSYLP